MQKLGIAGKLAAFALRSPLTLIIAIVILLLGIIAFILTPKEENPQIDVPMASVIVLYPGASAEETQKAIVEPLSRKLSELTGIEHIHGMAQNGVGVVTAQFKVGEKKNESLVKLYDRVMQNLDILPVNARNPIVKPMDIDEVPIYSIAISGGGFSQKELYDVARSMANPLAQITDASVVGIKGGEKRQFNILLNANKLFEYGLTPLEVSDIVSKSSIAYPLGTLDGQKFSVMVSMDGFIKNANDMSQIIIKTNNGKAIYLSDLATIEDGVNLQDKEYALISKDLSQNMPQATLFVSKKRGSNAVVVAEALQNRIDEIKKTLPSGIEIVVTRDDGLKAEHVVNELAFHLAVSIAIIVALLAYMLGRREALIVSLTIPLVFAVTLFVGMLVGQTINRITLFALILSLGLLVDDAIVVIENIHRRFQMNPKADKIETIILATNEVGGPTYIATIAVVFAFLPMLFVTGMMGSYMGPIPLNVPVAMFASLVIAFAFSPWLAAKLLNPDSGHHEPFDIKKTKLYIKYDAFVRPMFSDGKKRLKFWLIMFGLLAFSIALPAFFIVQAKMLPGSNVNTFNITIDLPPDASINESAKVAQCVGNILSKDKNIRDYETFIGMGGVVDFNGLLRGNSIKKSDSIAEIRVNLVDKSKRSEQSGDIVSELRPKIDECEQFANIKLVEDPPGPPVLSTIVTEVYGGDKQGRLILAQKIEDIFKHTKRVVDVDILGEKEAIKYEIHPNRLKASELGISVEQIALALSVGANGQVVGVAQIKNSADPVPIFVRYFDKKSPDDVMATPIRSSSGKLYRVSDVAVLETVQKDASIASKDLKEVELVTGEMDKRGSVYAMFEIRSKIKELTGYKVESDGTMRAGLIVTDEATGQVYHIKNDGEWTVTFDTFRDLGSAFGAALVLIYFLLVAYYGNFKKPGVVAATIPLTLIGIMPGHFIMNMFTPTYFTATSMIGFIALAGIVVRNAIMLVDFTDELILSGKNIEDAVIEAAVIRSRPIMLTALAIALASFVIVLDPVWNGLAVSLIFGVMSATILTLVVTPLMYWGHLIKKGKMI
ncbi:MAG: hypothetical protein RL154_1642 [Pseudomonadota bacterium]|jgi:multidrug efflux pump subunit AcrB